ncbi:hypothetical protein [Nocardia farcinica]|uniref:hypothetical protein n=1 Tax=Nocardia farcinica TaxID=37329 RepID=UPI002457F3DB|nr:hypothetical protein [Nocardia farcinica]
MSVEKRPLPVCVLLQPVRLQAGLVGDSPNALPPCASRFDNPSRSRWKLFAVEVQQRLLSLLSLGELLLGSPLFSTAVDSITSNESVPSAASVVPAPLVLRRPAARAPGVLAVNGPNPELIVERPAPT